MRSLRSCLTALGVAAAVGFVSAPHAAAQAGAWAPDTAAPGLGGRVFAFTTWQGATHAGGWPFAAPGGPIGCVARWDGAAWRPLGVGVDLLTGYGPLASTTVRAMCEYQGELVVAGTFDRAGGAPANNIARWNGTSWAPLGQGLVEIGWDADVRALAVYQNELWAAGTFDLAGGQPAAGLARWNGTTWTPAGSGLASSVGDAAGHALRAVGNELVLAGAFTSVAGVPANNIARWNGTSWTPYGAGFDAGATCLAVFGGQLVAGGYWSFSGTQFVPSIARWNGSSWQALGSGGPSGLVFALHPIGTTLYAGGAFTGLGSYVARFDGASWSSFGGVSGVFSGTSGSLVAALGEHGTELLVGGEFTRGGNPPQGAAAVASTGVITFDGSAWRPMGGGRGADGTVRGVVPFGSDWYAFGAFAQIGGAFARGLARWDGDAWHHVVALDGSVESAVVWGDRLVVSGTFTQVGGQPIAGTAQWDGVAWSQLGPPILTTLAVHQGQLYASGTGALRRWNGTSWTNAATVTGIVDDLHVHGDGDLYFTTTSSSQHRVLRWDGAQATVIGTPNDAPRCLGSCNGELVVGGRFTTINGTAANLLARWNGSTWSPLGGGVSGYAVDALAELDGRLYAGTNGDPRGFLLQWNGAAWSAVPGALDGLPLALHVDGATGSVAAFGALLHAGGLPVWNHAEWRTRPAWRNRLHGLAAAGTTAPPTLTGTGTLLPGTPWSYTVAAAPSHLGVLALGLARVDLLALGGTLVPSPDVTLLLLGDAMGASSFATPWPASVPAGVAVFAQAWLLDAAGPQGFVATNALECLAP